MTLQKITIDNSVKNTHKLNSSLNEHSGSANSSESEQSLSLSNPRKTNACNNKSSQKKICYKDYRQKI